MRWTLWHEKRDRQREGKETRKKNDCFSAKLRAAQRLGSTTPFYANDGINKPERQQKQRSTVQSPREWRKKKECFEKNRWKMQKLHIKITLFFSRFSERRRRSIDWILDCSHFLAGIVALFLNQCVDFTLIFGKTYQLAQTVHCIGEAWPRYTRNSHILGPCAQRSPLLSDHNIFLWSLPCYGALEQRHTHTLLEKFFAVLRIQFANRYKYNELNLMDFYAIIRLAIKWPEPGIVYDLPTTK